MHVQGGRVPPAVWASHHHHHHHHADADADAAYPSIRDIHAEAERHRRYYYPVEHHSFSHHNPQPSQPPDHTQYSWASRPFRKTLPRNYDSYRSIAHPFEIFSDSGHPHGHSNAPVRLFHMFIDRASEFSCNMYPTNTASRGGIGATSNGAPPTLSSASTTLPGADLYRSLRWSSQRPPMSKERKIMFLRSYLPDWVITLVLAGLLVLINKVHGFRREFSLTDTSIQHTYALEERVPMWLLGLTVVIIPALLIVAVSLGVSRSVWDLHNGLLGFVLAHCLDVTITTIIKVCVGRPRPDLVDRCQPRAGSVDATPYGLVTDAICSVGADDSRLRDGFRSFPSGHSSSAFAGLTFLTLYLAGKMHLFDRRGHAISAWLAVTPMLGAALIAISRTMDYRHHATDIIAGGLLGIAMAYCVYRLYYPPLNHPQSHKPYSPRIPHEGMANARHSGADYDDDDVEAASELGDTRHHTLGGGAPSRGPAHARTASDARMLSATKGVVQGYERGQSQHGKASLEDEYVPETVDRN